MSYEQLSAHSLKARKDHRCVWCGEVIPKGQIHERTIGKMDGEFQSSRYHIECATACTEWCRENDPWGDGYSPYGFYRGTPIEAGDKHELALYLFGQWEGEVAE